MITSNTNFKIKKYQKLLQKKYRKLEELFIVEGFHLVQEALKTNIVQEVLTSNQNYEGTLVEANIIKKLSTTKTPQPIIAICKFIKPKSLGNKVVALNNIQDPNNVGAIIRSAKAFGFDSVIVQGVDIYNPKTLRSSQGAIFSINVINVQNISNYFLGYEIVGALLDKHAMIYSNYHPPLKMMLVLGNEANGIEKNVINKLNTKVYIPINFESLNVASAAAILLNEYKQTTS